MLVQIKLLRFQIENMSFITEHWVKKKNNNNNNNKTTEQQNFKFSPEPE